ncbi:DUF4160 domain-containing protein [Thermalbibacter longus]|uniref:DUF4160 domain-containing protein n=1 Tax=Thermalbibacter longus TaxID=2951981 RepID=UPI00325FC9B4
MRIEIYPKDHNPPHFHARLNDGDKSASYRIDTLQRLAGKLPDYLETVVIQWAREHQSLLWQCWYETRPTIAAARGNVS